MRSDYGFDVRVGGSDWALLKRNATRTCIV